MLGPLGAKTRIGLEYSILASQTAASPHDFFWPKSPKPISDGADVTKSGPLVHAVADAGRQKHRIGVNFDTRCSNLGQKPLCHLLLGQTDGLGVFASI